MADKIQAVFNLRAKSHVHRSEPCYIAHRMKHLTSTFLLLLLMFIVATTLRTLIKAGTFKRLSPHSDYSEKMLPGALGAEDIVVDRQHQLAYISSCDRRNAAEPNIGAIMYLDLSSKNMALRNTNTNWAPTDFRPHGISLYINKADGSRRLFVVNHSDAGPAVEIFEVRQDSLFHVETIRGDFLKSPNDLVATGPCQFYFTNDHDAATTVSHWKDFLLIGTGEIGYFDGSTGLILEKGLRYPNGITLSPNQKELFVALTTDGSIAAYALNPWNFKYKTRLNTGVDNLDVAPDGRLWAAAHPKMLAFLHHARNPAERSPSQVLSVSADAAQQYTIVKEHYLNNGNPLSGSSVAVFYDGVVLVGSVFENGILILE